MKIAFFGTPEFSTFVLNELLTAGYTPTVIVTTPDKPAGRGLELQESPVKRFAVTHHIPVLQPEKLDATFISELKEKDIDLLIVAAYGKILPSSLLLIGKYPPLNVHPSLLPKYRGTSPVESQILAGEKNIGVTIIEMDEKMDHGPIVAQELVGTSEHSSRDELNKSLWQKGGTLLATIIPEWVNGTAAKKVQDEPQATFTKKMVKEDGEISLDDDPTALDRKWRAYQPWPGLYFFKDGKRIKITKAHFENGLPAQAGKFIIDEVIPENGKKMPFKDLSR